MPRNITDAKGATWAVSSSGKHTQYGADEVSIEFQRVGDGAPETRFARYSPRLTRSAEMALEDASDAALLALLGRSQPAWTSPDGDYGRTA